MLFNYLNIISELYLFFFFKAHLKHGQDAISLCLNIAFPNQVLAFCGYPPVTCTVYNVVVP
jgi:hypothetical protein